MDFLEGREDVAHAGELGVEEFVEDGDEDEEGEGVEVVDLWRGG